MKSYQYPVAVRQHSGAKGLAKLLFIALATYADDNGECFPSYARLATETTLSLGGVRKAIKKIPKSELQVIERGRATGHSTKYRITLNCVSEEHSQMNNCATTGHSDCVTTGHSETNCATTGHSTMSPQDTNCATTGHLTTHELPIELPNARKRASGSSSSASSPGSNGTADLPIPPDLQTPEFLEAWKDYDEHRHKIAPNKWTPLAKKKALKKCEQWGSEKAKEALNNSVMNGWQGLFEPKETAYQKPKRSLDQFGLPNL